MENILKQPSLCLSPSKSKLVIFAFAVPCAYCAGGVGKVQRFEDVLQQCACQRDRGSIAVLQTGRKSVIHENIQRPVVSWQTDREKLRIKNSFYKTSIGIT